MISGITQNKTRKIRAIRVTTIHDGRFFILSEIIFFAPFSLNFEIDPSRFGPPVSFSLIDFIYSPKRQYVENHVILLKIPAMPCAAKF